MTFFSLILLFTSFVLGWLVFKKTKRKVWLFISIGFLFLFADELLEIHEKTDFLLHQILGMEETGLTDRIDDLLLGCYALLGLIFFYCYREEFKKFPQALPLLKIGFLLLFIMVGLDMLTNRNDIAPQFGIEISEKGIVFFSLIDDIFKILAEGFFVAAFTLCLIRASSPKPLPLEGRG